MKVDNFSVYVRFARSVGMKNDCPPALPDRVARDPNGPTARQAFRKFDDEGKKPTSCRQPRVLQAAMHGKTSLNFHVTDVWGYAIRLTSREGDPWIALLEVDELRSSYPYLPDWVWKVLDKAAREGIK